ncbi:MAG: DUF2066 domain-containing protein [Alphaproteobacteria bacterium]|nr:DUF2066 domain-containing protein [Alphaproteobacteria bacterium]
MAGFSGAAHAGEAIVNSEVNVDVISKDPSAARSEAMAKAEIDGLRSLLERLGPPDQAKDIMNTLDSKQITSMVKSTQIVDEKISGNRYQAKLLVSFDGDAISKVMSGISSTDPKEFVPASVGSFLIIPALEFNNQKLLWEESNLWKTVWNQVALEVTTGDVLVPYGDQTDAAGLTYDTMMTADFQSLAAYALRYGVSDVVLLQGKFTVRPEMVLSVVVRRVGRQDDSVTVHTYRADPQETRDLLFARAARDIIAELQERKVDETANKQAVRGGDRKKIMMLASISTMSSWTELRKKLSELPMVDRVETLAVSARQVDISVLYRGSEESFTNAIKSKSIRLKKNPDYWVISND